MTKRIHILACLLAASALCSAALQEPQERSPDIGIEPPRTQTPGAGARGPTMNPQERIAELFAQVERGLESIDGLLFDAAAGDTARLAGLEHAGIDALLRNSVEAGRAAQRDIEEIIRIAQELGQPPPGSSSSSQSQSPSSQSSSPGGSQSGQDSQSNEAKPSMPEENAGAEQSSGEQPGADQPGGEQEGNQEASDGQKPDSPRGSEALGKNQSGDEVESKATGRAGHGDPSDRGWGNLPEHLRDTFRAENSSGLPTRYRDWIDSYYHKLNRQSGGR